MNAASVWRDNSEAAMIEKLAFCLITCLLIGASPAQKRAESTSPEQRYTLSVAVDLVVFNVTVTDKNRRPVSGLKADNFRVVEDDVEQEIRTVRAEDVPVTVGLVMDNSGSMAARRQDVISAAIEFVSSSNPQDEIFIVNFNDYVAVPLFGQSAFTSDYDELRNALLRTAAVGKTALYDGLSVALKRLDAGSHLRKALVVFSDGGDNASARTLDQVTAQAAASSATVFTIGMYDASDPDQNPKVLRELSKLTGGEFYRPTTSAELHSVWKKIAGGIRSQYTIGYVSSNTRRDGAFRKVRITAVDRNRKSLQVETRAGYLAPAAAPVVR